MSNILGKAFTDYKKLILLIDFNVEIEEEHLSEFKSRCNLKNLIKHKTCIKNPKNPPCMYLVLRTALEVFKEVTVFKQDFLIIKNHTITVLKQ